VVALVALNGVGMRPDYYIVPRDHVAALSYLGNRAWLAGPPAPGRERNPNPRRHFSPQEVAGYWEAWELLERSGEQRAMAP
jgi:hypothetical protein